MCTLEASNTELLSIITLSVPRVCRFYVQVYKALIVVFNVKTNKKKKAQTSNKKY